MNVSRLTKPCSRCGIEDPIHGQRYCRRCKNAYAREHRKPLTPEARVKMRARSYANVYQRRGKLVPEPCKACGSMFVQKHHPDYSKPLAVEWLCQPCHLQQHQ